MHKRHIDYNVMLTKYDQIFAEYDNIQTKSYYNDQIYDETFQERHFIKIKESNTKKYTGFFGGRAQWVQAGAGEGV